MLLHAASDLAVHDNEVILLLPVPLILTVPARCRSCDSLLNTNRSNATCCSITPSALNHLVHIDFIDIFSCPSAIVTLKSEYISIIIAAPLLENILQCLRFHAAPSISSWPIIFPDTRFFYGPIASARARPPERHLVQIHKPRAILSTRKMKQSNNNIKHARCQRMQQTIKLFYTTQQWSHMQCTTQ